MATKSILKTVLIKDSRAAGSLVRALENAKEKTAKEVKISRPCSEASRTDIQKMFPQQNGRV